MYDDSTKKVLTFYQTIFIFQNVSSSKIEMWEAQKIGKHAMMGQGGQCCKFTTKQDKY